MHNLDCIKQSRGDDSVTQARLQRLRFPQTELILQPTIVARPSFFTMNTATVESLSHVLQYRVHIWPGQPRVSTDGSYHQRRW